MSTPREPGAPHGHPDAGSNGSASRADARRNRERILDAAATVLSVDPSAGLVDVAREAGLSRATVYRHFADIEAVRAAFVAEANEVGRQVLQHHLPEMLARGGSIGVDDMLALARQALPLEHRWTRLIAGEPLPDAPLIDAFAPTVRAVLRRGQAAGEFRADLDLELVADALMSLAMLAVRKIHAEGVAPDRAVEILRVFLEGLRPSSRR